MIGPLYHPVMLAEEVATLDIVTEGRLVFGIGLGYRPEEFDYFGVPYTESGKRLDETLEIVKRLWTEDEISHHGRFWQLDKVRPHLRPAKSSSDDFGSAATHCGRASSGASFAARTPLHGWPNE